MGQDAPHEALWILFGAQACQVGPVAIDARVAQQQPRPPQSKGDADQEPLLS
jgi:hypothetical protein